MSLVCFSCYHESSVLLFSVIDFECWRRNLLFPVIYLAYGKSEVWKAEEMVSYFTENIEINYVSIK